MAQLTRLMRLCGVPEWTPEENPDVEVLTSGNFSSRKKEDFAILYRYRVCRLLYDRSSRCLKFVLAENVVSLLTELQTIFLWKQLTAGISMLSLLRGNGIVTVHGALLETPRGGVLLCGESGIGKSTTYRRWLNAGQTAYADDLVLLAFDGAGGISAYPLPTWSRCEKQGVENCFFPVTRRIPLCGALALDRAAGGAKEHLADLPSDDFCGQFFRALFYPILPLVRNFPEAEQLVMRDRVWHYVETLSKKFAPRVLHAALDGDLLTTLGEFL